MTPPDSGFDDPTNQPAPSVARPLCRECYHSEAGCICPKFSPLYMASPEPDLVFLRRRRDEICKEIAAQEAQEDFNEPPAWLKQTETERVMREQFAAREAEPATFWSGIFFAFLWVVSAAISVGAILWVGSLILDLFRK